MKVALVYDRINKWGGAESVLLALHELFPDAPLFTSVYVKEKTPWADNFHIRPSFLQSVPLLPKDRHENYPFLMGFAFESFTFDEFDLVISITHEFSKAIITKPHTLHVCYCLTPTSYLWSGYDTYFKPGLKKTLTKPLIDYLRFYDKIVANRPDHYIGISKEVQKRIKKYYNKESGLVYPPVTITKEQEKEGSSDYFLIVSRLVPNKRIDIAVEAFNNLGWPLKIIGTGRELEKLKAQAKSNIEFLGYLTDAEVRSYYRACKAFVLPGNEDFGITAVEAQSFGKPVIAYKKGGVLETVIEGKTGFFFEMQTPKSLAEVLKSADFKKIKPIDCIKNAERFSKDTFKKTFKEKINQLYNSYRAGYV